MTLKGKKATKEVTDRIFNSSITSVWGWRFQARRQFLGAKILFEKAWDGKVKFEEWMKGRGKGENLIEPGTEESLALDEMQLAQEATLLLAFGFENLLKGLWVADNFQIAVASINRIPKELETHNILNLAEKLSVPLVGRETHLLQTLSDMARWQARYLVSRSSDEFYNTFYNPRLLIMDNYPHKKDFPDEVYSVRDKVVVRINAFLELEKQRMAGD